MKVGDVKALRWAAGLALIVGSAGCGASEDGPAAAPDMPDVVGQQLDVALSDIEGAGFEADVDVEGGGTFGVVDESNWQVCDQTPAAGESISDPPKLTVDRSCGAETEETPTESDEATETTAPAGTTAPPPETGAPPSEEVLTAANSLELAAILAEPDNCSATIGTFAATYSGRTIEFDGNIATMGPHGTNETRYDLLVSPGDYSETTAIGPTFQFRDVGIADLHLTGDVPAAIAQGDNLHVVAKVEEFNGDQCLFFLDPVSTQVR